MSTAQRRGGKQSKLSAWQSLQSAQLVEVVKVEVPVEEELVEEISTEIETKTAPLTELKPLSKKTKTKTDGAEG